MQNVGSLVGVLGKQKHALCTKWMFLNAINLYNIVIDSNISKRSWPLDVENDLDTNMLSWCTTAFRCRPEFLPAVAGLCQYCMTISGHLQAS